MTETITRDRLYVVCFVIFITHLFSQRSKIDHLIFFILYDAQEPL